MGTTGLNTSIGFQLVEKIPVYPTIKPWPIVSHYRLWYSKSADDVIPYKLDDIFVFDGGEGLSFYPFAEIVCCYQY